jgi:hypothetical protein
MNTHTTQRQPASSRPSLMAVLVRSPSVIAAPGRRAIVTGMIIVGALLLAASGVIHLYLYGETNGYSGVPTIGPLFLAQGIVAILLALLLLGTRWLASAVAAAGMLIATAAGLLLTIEIGLFNFKESWSAPWAVTSFVGELVGGAILLIAAAALLRPARR